MALMFYIVIWECIKNVFHHVDVGNFFFAPNFDSSTGTAALFKTRLSLSSFTFVGLVKLQPFQTLNHIVFSVDL